MLVGWLVELGEKASVGIAAGVGRERRDDSRVMGHHHTTHNNNMGRERREGGKNRIHIQKERENGNKGATTQSQL